MRVPQDFILLKTAKLSVMNIFQSWIERIEREVSTYNRKKRKFLIWRYEEYGNNGDGACNINFFFLNFHL